MNTSPVTRNAHARLFALISLLSLTLTPSQATQTEELPSSGTGKTAFNGAGSATSGSATSGSATSGSATSGSATSGSATTGAAAKASSTSSGSAFGETSARTDAGSSPYAFDETRQSQDTDQVGYSPVEPSIRQRPPIPEPPPMTLLPPLSTYTRKPLAWRQKALKLSLDHYRIGKTLTRQLSTPTGKDEVLAAIGRTIEEFGFRVESYSTAAGHILAVSNADSAKLIFSVTSTPGAGTQIRMLIDCTGQSCNASFVDTFCEHLEAAINKRELL